jgi:hypothetical protein
MLRRLRFAGLARLLGALALAAGGAARAAPPAAAFPDVVPQVLRSPFETPDPQGLYFYAKDAASKKAGGACGPECYPRVERAELLPPKAYDAEKKLSAEDNARLAQALRAAYRYADVNRAYADGYRPEEFYSGGMGVHMHRIDLILDDALDPGSPEFLTYVVSRTTGRWQLIEVGYIRRGLTRPKLFDAPEAHGHFHDENICVQEIGGSLRTLAPSSRCDAPGQRRLGPIWMVHVAVNVYNPNGLFADEFQYPDVLSLSGDTYSFFGRKTP